MSHLENENHPDVARYIKRKLRPVTISIYPFNDIPATEMVKRNELEGWCWESTPFLSVFLGNENVVSRGNIDLPDSGQSNYPHSWIEFKYKDKEYVYDPALNYLYGKDNYYNKFNVRVIQQVQTQKIKDSLINLINNSNEKSIYTPQTNEMDDPFFRNNSEFSAKMKSNGEINKINIRFYSNG